MFVLYGSITRTPPPKMVLPTRGAGPTLLTAAAGKERGLLPVVGGEG